MQVPVSSSLSGRVSPRRGNERTTERPSDRPTDRVGDDMGQGYCRDVVYVLQLLQTLPRCGPYTADRIGWAGAARTDGRMDGRERVYGTA